MGHFIPEDVKYCLNNGKMVVGSYCQMQKTLHGLDDVFQFTSLQNFEVLLFTYYGEGLFDVSAFRTSCIEKQLPVVDICLRNTVIRTHNFICFFSSFILCITLFPILVLMGVVYAEDASDVFKIEIKPSHLYDYCHGVVSINPCKLVLHFGYKFIQL